MNIYERFDKEFIRNWLRTNNVETINARSVHHGGKTPLICAIQREFPLPCTMMLLANGADPKRRTALPCRHWRMCWRFNETGNFQVAKLLLCFRAMLNVPARKSDKINEKALAKLVAKLNKEKKKKRGTKSEESAVKKPECVAVEEAIWKEWQQMALNERINEQRKNPRRKGMGVRALSLDGGGIRGVVLVQMLIEIESMMYGEGLPSGDRQKRCVGTCRGHLTDRLPPTLVAPEGFGRSLAKTTKWPNYRSETVESAIRLLANNPSLELLEEISKENALGKKHNNPHHELECFVSLGTGKAPTVSVGSTSLEIGTALIGAIRNLTGILMDQTNVALDTIEDRILVTRCGRRG
ncbi:hypothetical protein niasHS_001844 [Heterodera schachtii]|uniref:Uncharacterized protein n=1 Tax=Heterodera schachtii TaxID=97005 RepID=A0ABD2KAG7_HETSC